jgi:hypothetical protein
VFQAELCPGCGSGSSGRRPHTHGPTLVDCGCEAKVYQDGSGIEINYCPMHQAANQMLQALKDVVEQADKTSLMLPADLADSIRVFGRAAIAAAGG